MLGLISPAALKFDLSLDIFPPYPRKYQQFVDNNQQQCLNLT